MSRRRQKTTYGDTLYDTSNGLTFRYVYDLVTMRCIGRLYDTISQATAEASPGIQSWSHPRAKGGPDVKLADGGATILSFSDYCRRHLVSTYPHTKR